MDNHDDENTLRLEQRIKIEITDIKEEPLLCMEEEVYTNLIKREELQITVKEEKQEQKYQIPIYNGEKIFHCDQCDYKSSKAIFLKQHKLCHNATNLLSCNYKCLSQFALKQHQKTHVDAKKRPKITRNEHEDNSLHCSKQFTTTEKEEEEQDNINTIDQHTSKLQYLQNLNTVPVLYCNQCSYQTDRLDSLKTHKLTHANKMGPFYCKRCDYKSNLKIDFLIHNRTHSRDEPFRCKHCDYTSNNKINLKRHELTHNNGVLQQFCCDQCDFKCVGRYLLNQHKNIHNQQPPFRCDRCRFITNHKSCLDRHEKKIHCKDKSTKNTRHIFFCNKCDFICIKEDSLTVHKQIHTKE